MENNQFQPSNESSSVPQQQTVYPQTASQPTSQLIEPVPYQPSGPGVSSKYSIKNLGLLLAVISILCYMTATIFLNFGLLGWSFLFGPTVDWKFTIVASSALVTGLAGFIICILRARKVLTLSLILGLILSCISLTLTIVNSVPIIWADISADNQSLLEPDGSFDESSDVNFSDFGSIEEQNIDFNESFGDGL